MQKFKVMVDGGHSAEVHLDVAHNTFTGQVISPDYGIGEIKNGKINDNNLEGVVDLAGYEADFSAVISSSNISGHLKYGWFFNKSFSGTVLA